MTNPESPHGFVRKVNEITLVIQYDPLLVPGEGVLQPKVDADLIVFNRSSCRDIKIILDAEVMWGIV